MALYNGKLTYLAKGLEKHKNSLENERDAITITVSLETANEFMKGLDTEGIEDAFMKGLSRDPVDYLSVYGSQTQYRSRVVGPRGENTINRYIKGNTISPKRWKRRGPR